MSSNNAPDPIEDNFISDGWARLDPTKVEKRPPKIAWEPRFYEQPLEDQASYLMKLANSMNHAAKLLQDERDTLNEICWRQERQIETMNEQLSQNNLMLQTEVTRMNEERQLYNDAAIEKNGQIRALQERIRELENGGIH